MNEEIRQRTKWFMEDRFGMFIHWGLYSIPACGEWMMSQKEMTIEEYSKYFDQLGGFPFFSGHIVIGKIEP